MDSTFHIAYRDDAFLFMHNMKMCRPGLLTLIFSEISSVRWIGSGDSGQMLVVRTELRQRERQLRSSGLFTLS